MRLATISIIVTLAAAKSAGAGALPPPIERAAVGQQQCYAPDFAKKTCRSLASYESTSTGVLRNKAVVLLAATPVVTMTTVTEVTVVKGQVCGAIAAQDIDVATFEIAGSPATDEQAALLKSRMKTAQASFFGRQICTAYVGDGASVTAKASIDGAAQPAMDQQVIWVSPSDGYRVAP